MADIVSNASNAAVAYADALNQARNTTNMLFRQYGFVMPGSDGYSVENAQSAFDPNKLFSSTTGQVDPEAVKLLAGQMQMGGKGRMADIQRGGAGMEAEAVAASRAAGISGGGLMEQRRRLAEAQTTGDLETAKQEFIAGIGQGMAPIGGAWQTLQTANVDSATTTAGSNAITETTPNPSESPPGSAANKPPSGAHQYQRWTNPSTGAKFQYINGKWKKVGRR